MPTQIFDDDTPCTPLEKQAREYLKAFVETTNFFNRPVGLPLPSPRDYAHLFHMLRKYPRFAKEEYYSLKVCPLHILLSGNARLEIIQEVYTMYPDAVKVGGDLGGDPALHYALVYKCNLDVIYFLVEKYPTAASICMRSSFRMSRSGRSISSPRNTIPIIHVLDRWSRNEKCYHVLKLLHDAYPPDNWTENRQNELQNQLVNTMKISSELPKEMLVWLAKKNQQQQGNSDQCCLNLGSFQGTRTTPLIENLQQFFSALRCKELILRCSWDVSTNRAKKGGRFITRLLSEVNIPSTLAVRLDEVNFCFPSNFNVAGKVWSACQLQELTLTKFGLASNESCSALFQMFGVLPNLKKLTLFAPFSSPGLRATSCTDQVINLLENQNLDQLIVAGGGFININVPKLSQALQKSSTNSTSLVWYTKLNCYLEPTIFKYEIAYHSAMNHHGRAVVSSEDATGTLLVDCLCSVQGSYSKGPRKLEESVLYGLLRAAPGLWAISGSGGIDEGATSTKNKKRPADDSEPLVPHTSKKMTKK